MITKNDLYDISTALIHIRSHPQYECNVPILDAVLQVLSNRHQAGEDQIRNAIATVDGLDRERWYYVYQKNGSVDDLTKVNPACIEILIEVCNSLKMALVNNQFEKAYDLADAVHCLPEIIANNSFCIPNSYWKTHIKPYRKKWDKTFLTVFQKKI